MLRSFLRYVAPVVILLPFGAAACGDDEAAVSGNDAGTGNESGTRNDSDTGNDGAGSGDGSSGGDGSVVTPNTTAPTVLGNDPAAAATGVATNAPISATSGRR